MEFYSYLDIIVEFKLPQMTKIKFIHLTQYNINNGVLKFFILLNIWMFLRSHRACWWNNYYRNAPKSSEKKRQRERERKRCLRLLFVNALTVNYFWKIFWKINLLRAGQICSFIALEDLGDWVIKMRKEQEESSTL